MTVKRSAKQLPETVGQALEYCFELLQASDAYYGHGTDNPWDEAVQLVLSVAELPMDADAGTLSQPLDSSQKSRISELLQRRIGQRIPLPYLLGQAYFAGLAFRCDPRAIVPRSPIAELILRDYSPWYCGPAPRAILDLCCGGGCIGLAAAHYSEHADVDLVDIDPAALELAAENRSLLHLESRVKIVRSDLFASLPPRRYDLILSNPPYVDSDDLSAMPEEFHREPEIALGSGADGLDLTRRILAEAAGWLVDTGLLVVEVGNSWLALEEAYPQVPFTWLEFEHGGHGVFALSAAELQEFSACFCV